jgi:PAS domain S-box-containing protein
MGFAPMATRPDHDLASHAATAPTIPERPSRAWLVYVAAGTAAAAAYAVGGWGTAVKTLMLTIASLSSCLALALGVRRNHSRELPTWVLFAAGQFCFLVGNCIWLWYRVIHGAPIPFPSAGDVFFLGAYAMFVPGLVLVIRRQRVRRNWMALLDASIFSVGVTALAWVLLIEPYAHLHGVSWVVRLTSIAYPAMDVAILALMVRLAMGHGARSPAYYLVLASFAGLLVADVIYGLELQAGAYQVGGIVEVGWLLSYLLMGAAALHPSMLYVGGEARRRTSPPARIALLTGAMLMVPGALLIQSLRHQVVDIGELVGLSAVMSSLVMVRVAWTVRQLTGSEARKSAILSSSLDCIITIDQEGRIVEFNSSAERTLGYRASDVVGKALADVVIPERFRADHSAGLAHYLATGETKVIGRRREVTALRADGTEFPAELAVTRVGTPGQANFTGYLRDITDRRQAEATRRELAAIVESSADAIIGETFDGIITSWNRGAEMMFGYSQDEAVGRSFTLLQPPGVKDGGLALVNKVRRGEAVVNHETVRLRKDGTPISVAVTLSPLVDTEGAAIGASAIFRDMTERLEVERRIRRGVDRLETLHAIDKAILSGGSIQELASAALRRLRALAWADRGSVLLIDTDAGTATYLAAEPPGRGPGAGVTVTLDTLLPLDVLAASDLIEIEDLASPPMRASLMDRLVEAGLRSTVTARLVADGAFLGVLTLAFERVGGVDPSVRDIVREVADQLAVALQQTRLKETLVQRAEDLERAVSDLRRVDRERRQLLSRLVTAQEEERREIASDIHDDPVQKLTAASVRLDIVEGDYPDLGRDPTFRKAQETIGHAIESLRHLMFELRPYVLDRDGLVAALRLVLNTEEKRVDGCDYRLDAQIASEPDAETRVVMYRIALEALANVRKHARASRVEVSLCDQDGGYLLRLSDDGAGFDAIARGQSPDGHLGLTSMRERAEMASGWFRLQSAPGTGTTVEVWLPDGGTLESERLAG